MATGCVSYVIDSGYLLQALVSAAQARRCVSPAIADIVILCVGKPDGAGAALQRIADEHGVELIFRSPADIDGRHIMFGRLYLHRMLAERYRRIVYIDGDTQVMAPLEPLFAAEIPDGCFLACRDPSALFAQISPQWLDKIVRERRAAGFTRPHTDYFNSGVLVIDRASWPALFADCVALIDQRGSELQYPDQDILNIAVGDRCRLISTRWNFPGFLIGSPEEEALAPAIYHFMSNPRPWNEAVPPWGERWARPYAEMLGRHPALQALAPSRSLGRSLRYWAQQRYKMMSEYRAVGRFRELEPDLRV